VSRILILDDDEGIRRSLEIMLKGDGHHTLAAASAEGALALLEREPTDIALVDLQLPGMDGIAFTKALRDRRRDVDVVIITAHGSVESAVEAMKEGSFDYLTKPFSPEQVRHRLSQIERLRGLRSEVASLKTQLGGPQDTEILTRNPKMRHLLELARTASETDATVLITGESGVGKGLLARRVHAWSARKNGSFTVVDCAAFQETLLESDLFGHKKGAFTGAATDKPGKVELAGGGTLFLDEIGEVPLALQAKLLRLVEERAFERLGDPAPRMVDARIVVATNRDLNELVAEKQFRPDLFFRLSVVELAIPPLRNRPEDISLLAERFTAQFAERHKRPIDTLGAEVERFLVGYGWPGNVRELMHVIERAVLLCPGRTIRMDHLPERLRVSQHSADDDALNFSLAELEEHHIRRVLAQNLSQEETASRLGIDPSTLWRKRKKYGI